LKKIIKIFLKFILALIAVFVIAFIALKIRYNEEVPTGVSGKPADELAYKILENLNYNNYKNAKEIHWTFKGVNRYEWKKQQHIAEVFWDDNHVTLLTQSPYESTVLKSGEKLEGDAKKEAIDYAVKNFNNDSFWLVAPFKLFDPGTERFLVKEDGKEKLLVQYTSGGTTPGDAYLWEVDENFQPTAFKMWVSIIPFDGLEAQWSDWEMTEAGFLLSTKKTIFGLDIPITQLKVIQ
jgi:hypothetical protein